MDKGICTKCGVIVNLSHTCSDDMARLAEIDRLAGPRALREILLAEGKKGFNNKIEELEAEASLIRLRL